MMRPRMVAVVIDDDPAFRATLRALALEEGFRVLDFANGEAAARDPEVLAAEVIMADLMLPGMSGLAIVSALRAMGYAGRAYLVTGHTDLVAGPSGLDGVIGKPADMDLILAALRGEGAGRSAEFERHSPQEVEQ